MIDLALHEVFVAIKDRQIKWQDFRDVGIEEYYCDYYYAEDELYVIRDRIFDSIMFVKAKSPKEAYKIWRDEIDAVESAMSSVIEAEGE